VLLPVHPPPVMWDPSYAVPEDVQQATSVPTDPYTSLKQNYEAVIAFLTLVRTDPTQGASICGSSTSRPQWGCPT
jgi:hypothetical protein